MTCGFGPANDLLAIVLPGFHNGKPFAGFLSVTMQLHHRESRALPAQNQQTGNFMYFLDFRFAGSEYRFHPEAGIRPVRLNEILYFPTCFFKLLISPILRESPLFRAALPSQSPWEFCHRFRLRQDLPHASPGMQQLICAPGRRFHAVGPIHFPVLD